MATFLISGFSALRNKMAPIFNAGKSGASLILFAVNCSVQPVYAAQPMGCLIEPESVAEVGSQVIGVIESVNVDRGDLVHKGQVLATLRADVERASVSVADSRAQAEAEVRSAAANLAFNQQRRKRAEDLYNKKFISQQALDQTRTETDLAEHKLIQSREQQRILQRERSLATAQLSQRTIRSPMDGVIVERYLSPGERVEEKPLIRVAKVNPLRVQVVVPTVFFGKIRIGDNVNITPELPDLAGLSASVIRIDKVIDAASNTFRVQLELPNPEMAIPAGLRCKADFGLNEEPTHRNTNPLNASVPAKKQTSGIRPTGLKLDKHMPILNYPAR